MLFFSSGDVSGHIYRQKTVVRQLVFLIALIIAAASVWYTQTIVKDLKYREKHAIELHAKSIEYAANNSNTGNLTFLFQEIIIANNTIPVILTDKHGKVISHRNIEFHQDITDKRREKLLSSRVQKMRNQHPPIRISFKGEGGKEIDYDLVYYQNSDLLVSLQYYPFVQLTVISVFGIIVYLLFSYSRTAEQNKVWVGLAKETAHQLGTPISSIMAWVDYLKTDTRPEMIPILAEVSKDIHKLQMVTERFSNIGSVPELAPVNLVDVVEDFVAYLKLRVSRKVCFNNQCDTNKVIAMINRPLFEWVLENVFKNAVDAIQGEGSISYRIFEGDEGRIHLDIKDTGKGISRLKFKQIFNPGVTTKKRGWGLGLTLAKRIIETYHKGKIYILESSVNTGTTFRILLNKPGNYAY